MVAPVLVVINKTLVQIVNRLMCIHCGHFYTQPLINNWFLQVRVPSFQSSWIHFVVFNIKRKLSQHYKEMHNYKQTYFVDVKVCSSHGKESQNVALNWWWVGNIPHWLVLSSLYWFHWYLAVLVPKPTLVLYFDIQYWYQTWSSY